MFKIFTLYLFLIILSFGCATTHIKLENLLLGMTKRQVINSIGKPDNLIGSKITENNQIAEIFEYISFQYPTGYGYVDTFWLKFINDRLIQWGRPVDFEEAPNKIEEFRLR